MANANLFQAYLQPPKSVSDYMAEMDSQDIRREQLKTAQSRNAIEAMTLQDTLDQRRTAAEDRNALQRIAMGWSAETTPEQRIAALRNSGRAGLMSQADALEKGSLERKKIEAEANEKGSKVADETLKRYRTALDYIDTPQAAQRWLQAQLSDPTVGPMLSRLMDPQQAMQSIPSDPAQFQQWRQRAAMGMEKFIDMQRQQGEADQRARNDLIGPDGKINQQVVGAKQQIARAGASQVNVNTDNLGLKPKDRFEMEGKLADDFKQVTKIDSGVLAATRKISTSLTKDGALKDQAAIYSFAKMLDPEGAVRESDYAAIANTSGLVDRVRNYANRLLTGEQLTPQQRNEMLELAKAFEGVANQRIKKAQGDFAGQAQRYNLRPEAVYGAAQPDEQPAGGNVVDFGSLK